MKEFKSFPFAVKSIEGRAVTGVFAVFGNRDQYGDRLMPGCMTKTISEQAGRIRHLWNHDFTSPPIATVRSLRQLSRDELPETVLQYAPDATGGAEVTREYLSNDLAEWVFEALGKNAINEMSFAFETVKADYSEEMDAAGRKQETRIVREVKLYETSDVLWGANPATAAVRSLPVEAVADTLRSLLAELKEGRRNSAQDLKMLQQIHDHAKELGALCEEKAMTDDDKEKSSEPAEAAPVVTIAPQLALAEARLRAMKVFGF
ncbi:MAG TPA: HK97 family phage prohead protease [Blastocatellia bacterium]|nr:HK97 family phage prohead protease [Blastocatellia bacterium]